MEVMYHRKNGKRYEVYEFIAADHNYALCYDVEQAGRDGQGWCRIRLKDLIPEAHANKITGQFMSKTERNKIKSNIKIVTATLECTDGLQYSIAEIDDAIEHQRQLMRSEDDQ